jgi:PEP-CTERM motif
MKFRTLVKSFAVLLLSAASVWAAPIIQYDVESITSTQTVGSVPAINPAAGVTGIDVTRGAGLTPASASFSINSSGWTSPQTNDYYEFGFNTTQSYQVNQLTVGLRSSNTGPGFVNLLYSKDGGSFTLLNSTGSIPLMGTDYNNLVADLSEIGVVNDSLVFRLVVDPAHSTDSANGGTIGSGGTFRFASYSPSGGVFLNPEITGDPAAPPTAVPEPASLFVWSLGLVGLVVVIGRRRCEPQVA